MARAKPYITERPVLVSEEFLNLPFNNVEDLGFYHSRTSITPKILSLLNSPFHQLGYFFSLLFFFFYHEASLS